MQGRLANIPRKGTPTTSCSTRPSVSSGRWRAEVTARVSDFDAYSAGTQFDVRK